MKKAEMAMGTLIIFIAMILVAAVAASVLISTTSKLHNKALDTGKMTTQEVGTSLIAAEVYAENGTSNYVNYFFPTIKLSAGSEPIRFSDLLLTLSLGTTAQDYIYSSAPNCTDSDYSELTTTTYGLQYLINGTTHADGYLNKGDVAKLCFESPIQVNETEDIKIVLVPKVGSALTIETTMPDLMVQKRIQVFP